MKNRYSFVEAFQSQVFSSPNKTALIFLLDGEHEKEKITYAELDEKSKNIAAYLQTVTKSGDRVLLCYSQELDLIYALLGCFYAGVIAVPVYPLGNKSHSQRLKHIIQDCDPKIILGTTKSLAIMQNLSEFSKFSYSQTDTLTSKGTYTPITISFDTLAFLQYTSGSTGNPKGVMVSHGNLQANINILHDIFQIESHHSVVSWLPMQHDMGLIGQILQTLYYGATLILMTPNAFLEKPLRWLQAITHYKAYSSGAPNFGYQLCVEKITPEQIKDLDLSSWKIAFNGAEPVREETLVNFYKKFSPCGFAFEDFLPGYGMAETTLVVSAKPKGKYPVITAVDKAALSVGRFVKHIDSLTKLVSSGNVDKSYTIKIVNPKTLEIAPAHEIGEIWLCSPSVAQGYWNKPDVTAEVFHAQLKNDNNRYLRTGDLGSLVEGELYITGRLKDILILQGRNIYPQDIEFAVDNCNPAIRAGCTAAFTMEIDKQEQIFIVAEISRTARKMDFTALFSEIRAAVADVVDVIPYSIQLLAPAQALKTTSGKIQRAATKSTYVAGKLDILAQDNLISVLNIQHISQDQIQKDISNLLAKILRLEEIDPYQTFSFQGGTSLQAITFSQQLKIYVGENIDLSPTVAFDFPTVQELAHYLYLKLQKKENIVPSVTEKNSTNKEPIAIIGMHCRFPGGANNPELFWKLLAEGKEGIGRVPHSRWDINNHYYPNPESSNQTPIWHGAFIEGMDLFDAEFFNISPREAQTLDPQQRLLLEVTWHALENAGINPLSLKNSDTSVFIGASTRDYSEVLLQKQLYDTYISTGNAASVLSGRLSFSLGLQGPCLTLDTACSSSLVALHEACNSLHLNETQLAIVGGVNALLSPNTFINLGKAGMLSTKGHCKVFSENADGYVRGEGCGVVILKKISDAQRDRDTILGIIKGTAINQDGASSGLTVPNGIAQEKLLNKALKNANVAPSAIDYIEAHGTGTQLGDPMETHAIANVFKESHAQNPLVIGSVKSNIGHLEAAAGIAGLIKVILCFQHESLPRQINSRPLNSKIDLQTIPAIIPEQSLLWHKKNHPRCAALSSFGFSGTNAHVILEEGLQEKNHMSVKVPAENILLLSAKTEKALRQLQDVYMEYLEISQENIANICYTSQVSRAHFPLRLVVIGTSKEEIKEKLKNNGMVKLPSDNMLARKYLTGEDLNWHEINATYSGLMKVQVPLYPFQHERFWIQDLFVNILDKYKNSEEDKFINMSKDDIDKFIKGE